MVKYEKGELKYIGSSPDDLELVKAASLQGYKLIETTIDTKTIKISEKNFTFEILKVLGFSSERKRMSIIVKDKTGIKLYIKGADCEISKRLSKKSMKSDNYDVISNGLIEFSKKGLRTLMVAYRKINNEDYNYAKLFATISQDFFIYPNTLRKNPEEIIKECVRPYEEKTRYSVAAEPRMNFGVNANNDIDFDLCQKDVFLFGCYKSAKHVQWIHEHKLYNVRLDKERKGSIEMKEIIGGARFLILYDFNDTQNYEIWRLGATQFYYTKEDLEKLFYPQPNGNFYFVYELIEKIDSVILGIESNFSKDGTPIYKKGCEL